jgi:sugar/nucleoside kinase (ribokinase family)
LADPILVVGSVALDDVRTPFGAVEAAFGGSATYFSLAARCFAPVRLVAVVGEDFPPPHRALLAGAGIDTAGLEVAPGRCFRWGGEYGYDLNTRTTLFTDLNVFEHFHPKVPAAWRETPVVFLGNIHPELQAEVLDQVRAPRLVALDTMNLWIETARAALCSVLRRVDLLIVNDSEARELAGTSNLIRAGQALRDLGPRIVVIKKGEHGALAFSADGIFACAALALDEVRDPTGAGDSFAGGLVGGLAAYPEPTPAALRRGIALGTVMASFTVQDFGIERLCRVVPEDVRSRCEALRQLTQFEPIDASAAWRP